MSISIIKPKYMRKDDSEFILPRTEFLLHQVKDIENKLIAWCKNNKYSQGDDYSVRVTNKGKWAVSYSNDYPLQHGSGKEFILTEQEFIVAMDNKALPPHLKVK